MEPAVWFIAGMAVGVWLAVIVVARHRIMHRIRFKKVYVKCPTCNGEGTVPASNAALLRVMMAEGSDEAIEQAPRFPCSECDGDKRVSYEFPRLQKVEIDADGRITGDSPQNTPR